jgi:hypothetical protein
MAARRERASFFTVFVSGNAETRSRRGRDAVSRRVSVADVFFVNVRGRSIVTRMSDRLKRERGAATDAVVTT